MDERDWRIINSLHEHLNITKTAKILYISQPALTERIKRVEEELGVRILYRGSKGVKFTAIGEYVAEAAAHRVQETQELREHIDRMRNSITGVLRIAAPSILSEYYLPRLLGKFQGKYPQVQLEIKIAQSSDIISLMNAKKVHFGFLRNAFGWNENEKLLLTTNYVTAASGKPFKIKDLPQMDCVDYVMDQYYRALLSDWWNKTYDIPVKIGMRVSNLNLCKEMIFNGLGYGFLPSILLPQESKLYSHPLQYANGDVVERKTWLIYKKENMDIQLMAAFYEFVSNCDFESFLLKK